MTNPTLVFEEHKTNFGIQLVGTISLQAVTTIPNYTSDAIDHRKQAEQFIKSEIVDSFIRLKGRHKIIDALHKLDTIDDVENVKEVLSNLLKELDTLDVEIIGAKP